MCLYPAGTYVFLSSDDCNQSLKQVEQLANDATFNASYNAAFLKVENKGPGGERCISPSTARAQDLSFEIMGQTGT